MGVKRSRAGRIISIGGGKGGVGKSIVAANLGLAMAQVGARVIIVDADLGAANLHSLFGILRTGCTLQGLIDGTIDSLDKALISTDMPNLKLIPGCNAVVGSANIEHSQKLKLIRHIRGLDAEVVIIDVGAGVSFNVLDLFDMADYRVVVTTSQLTSVQNAYAFLKGAVWREMRRLAFGPAQVSLFEDDPEGESTTGRVLSLVARVRETDAGFADVLIRGLAGFGAYLLGNQMIEPRERGAIYGFSRMIEDFLGIEAPVLGILKASRRIHDSVSSRRAYMYDAGQEECAVTFRALADKLLCEDVATLRRNREELTARDALSVLAGAPPGLLGGQAGETPDLPADLEAYERGPERHLVDCPATLVLDGGSASVRLREMSDTGASLTTDGVHANGAVGQLLMLALPGRPRLRCIVRNSSQEQKHTGVEFIGERRLTREILGQVLTRFARETPKDPGPEGAPPAPSSSSEWIVIE